MHVQSRPAVSEQPFSSLEIFHNGCRAWEELLLTTGQMALFRPSPSLPMEVLGMIAKEADDEDIPAQRLVCPLWASVTATKFALLFHETAFEFSRAGMLNLLALLKNPRLGPQIRMLIIFDDLKRKKVGKFHELYDQALVALSAYGQPLRFGVRWAPVASGERVDPKMASTRLINIMLKRVLPAAEAAGLDRNNLLLELPDASRTQVAGNDYRKIIWWISRVWNEHNIFRRPFNPNLTIRFASTPGMSANPTIILTRSPNKVECRNLLAVHMAAFSSLIQSNYHREIHLVDCVVSDHFYDFNWGNFHNITMENVTLYEGVFTIDDHPLHRYAAGETSRPDIPTSIVSSSKTSAKATITGCLTVLTPSMSLATWRSPEPFLTFWTATVAGRSITCAPTMSSSKSSWSSSGRAKAWVVVCLRTPA
jgi:hypothetical protein